MEQIISSRQPFPWRVLEIPMTYCLAAGEAAVEAAALGEAAEGAALGDAPPLLGAGVAPPPQAPTRTAAAATAANRVAGVGR
jgi:hypothetical protein